jgi:hypothetical protein
MKILYIADYFAHDHNLGGGELNDKELLFLLSEKGCDIEAKETRHTNRDFLIQPHIKGRTLIVSNFLHLSKDTISFIIDNFKYIIYEHDHKYLKSRNPAEFEKCLVPKEKIINYEFYKNATAIVCQSTFHENIIKKNLQLDNIYSVGGNLWSEETLDFLLERSKKEKKDKCSIMNSTVEHKNTEEAVRYCLYKKMDYELINRSSYLHFLKQLSANKKLVFFPKTPETLCRVIVEARMMGMIVITNSAVGATKEGWFELKGEPLVDLMRQKRFDISDKIMEFLRGK